MEASRAGTAVSRPGLLLFRLTVGLGCTSPTVSVAAAPYGVAVVANASVRFAVLPLLARTKKGTKVLPKWSSPS